MSPSRKLVCALAVSAALAAPALVWAAPSVTEYASGLSSGAQPHQIAAGPDGNLWFTENARGRIALVTPGGTITEFTGLSASSKPAGITAGPDGAVWFTEEDNPGTIGRITTAGDVTEFELSGNRKPLRIAAGPDGNLWFTESASPAAIGRITPSGAVTEFSAGLSPASAPQGIAAGPDGNLWFTENASPGRIGRITPAGAITEFSAGLTPGARPEEIVAGPDGNLWFTESAAPARIGRITPAGVITEFSNGLTPDSQPNGIAVGGDGALWFTETADPGRIGRITTSGTITEHAAGLSPNAHPQDIAAAPDGNLWFTERGDPGRVALITVPPGVSAPSAADVTETGATLGATVRANAQATQFTVQYGRTTVYPFKTASAAAGASGSAQAASAAVTDLVPGTTYHFRIVATNDSGTTVGPDGTFTTGGTAPPPPKPVRGKSVVAGVVSGTVLVRIPGSSRFVALDGVGALPVGTVLDTTGGKVRLKSALRSGAVQSATFWAGVFQVRQARRGSGATRLLLRGGPSPASCARSAGIAAEQGKGRRPARLWGKDRNGRYHTHGRNSVAAVRGTTWLTEERCTGTLTRVTEGAVVVRDLGRRVSVVVRAGRSYLARRSG